jgi:YcxB-like protein
MAYQVTLRYDEQLIRRAVLCFWWRLIGLRFVIAIVVIAACLVILVAGGDRSWFVGVLATVLVFGIAFMVAIYVVHYRSAFHKLKKLGDPEATLTLSESSLSMSSSAGSSTVPWSAVTELWQFPSFWLMFFSRNQFVTLPLADFAPDAMSFVLERVRASGGKTS